MLPFLTVETYLCCVRGTENRPQCHGTVLLVASQLLFLRLPPKCTDFFLLGISTTGNVCISAIRYILKHAIVFVANSVPPNSERQTAFILLPPEITGHENILLTVTFERSKWHSVGQFGMDSTGGNCLLAFYLWVVLKVRQKWVQQNGSSK